MVSEVHYERFVTGFYDNTFKFCKKKMRYFIQTENNPEEWKVSIPGVESKTLA